MIRGYFSTAGAIRRPFLYCDFEFPGIPHLGVVGVELLVDTGADRTILSPIDAENIGLNTSNLDMGRRSSGIGGSTLTRIVKSRATIQGYSMPLTLHIPEVRQPIPSLLGRDFMSSFALFMEERSGRVMFFDQEELDSLGLTVGISCLSDSSRESEDLQ